MSNLNDLELPDNDEGDEQLPDFDSLPPQFGDFSDPIQPATYKFIMPKAGPIFEAIVGTDNKPRLKAIFKDHCQLRIADSTEKFRLTVSSIPMNKGEGKPKVSNMTYLLAALQEAPKSGSRKDMGAALDKACAAEKAFLGTTTLTSYCNPKEDVYDPETGEKKAGVKGCGRRYSSSPYKPKPDKYAANVGKGDPHGGERFAVPKAPIYDEKGEPTGAVDPAKFAFRFVCKCGNNALRAFAGIEVFRSA